MLDFCKTFLSKSTGKKGKNESKINVKESKKKKKKLVAKRETGDSDNM